MIHDKGSEVMETRTFRVETKVSLTHEQYITLEQIARREDEMIQEFVQRQVVMQIHAWLYREEEFQHPELGFDPTKAYGTSGQVGEYDQDDDEGAIKH